MKDSLSWIIFMVLPCTMVLALPVHHNTETILEESPTVKQINRTDNEQVISVRITSSVAVGRRNKSIHKVRNNHERDNEKAKSFTIPSSIAPIATTTEILPDMAGANIEFIKQLNAKKETRGLTNYEQVHSYNFDKHNTQDSDAEESINLEKDLENYENVPLARSIALSPTSSNYLQGLTKKPLGERGNSPRLTTVNFNVLHDTPKTTRNYGFHSNTNVNPSITNIANQYNDEKAYSEPAKLYSEPAKIYSEPAKIYNEPAKVYNEPAKIYSEAANLYNTPAEVYNEPAKVYSEPAMVYNEPAKVYNEQAKVYNEPAKVYNKPAKVYNEPAKVYSEPAMVYNEPAKDYNEPAKVYNEPAKVYNEPAKVYNEPAKVYSEPAKVYNEPAKVYSQPAQVYGEPAKFYGEPAKVYSEPAKIYSEPAKVYSEPSKIYSEPAKFYSPQAALHITPQVTSDYVPWGHSDQSTLVNTTPLTPSANPTSAPSTKSMPEQEKNYEVDEKISVLTEGRSHGVQDTNEERCKDENCKVGYVVEGRQYRKYRVEERTPDGFIVGEYGVVRNEDGALRGVRYTADGDAPPRLIYDALMKFLQLK